MKLNPFSKNPMDDGHLNSLNKIHKRKPNTKHEKAAGPPLLDNKHVKIINGENELQALSKCIGWKQPSSKLNELTPT